MHFANGRVAKNGDKVVRIGTPGNMYPVPMIGILHDAVPGNDTCNGSLAPSGLNQLGCNLAECLHVDDIQAALGDITKIPDSSQTKTDTSSGESAPQGGS